MVPDGQNVIDVGTDHAYIPIALVEDRRVPSAVASDIGKGPLERAAVNIREHGLSDRIRTILCDGVPPGDVEGTLVLAGMGGILMRRILGAAKERLGKVPVIVAEPQSDPDIFREALAGTGYGIADEAFLKEDGKYYSVIKAQRLQPLKGAESGEDPGGREERTLFVEMDPCELLFGPVILRTRNDVFDEYLKEQAGVCQAILKKLDEAGLPEDHPGREAQKNKDRLIRQAQQRRIRL